MDGRTDERADFSGHAAYGLYPANVAAAAVRTGNNVKDETASDLDPFTVPRSLRRSTVSGRDQR
jgi:hypothetical protein